MHHSSFGTWLIRAGIWRPHPIQAVLPVTLLVHLCSYALPKYYILQIEHGEGLHMVNEYYGQKYLLHKLWEIFVQITNQGDFFQDFFNQPWIISWLRIWLFFAPHFRFDLILDELLELSVTEWQLSCSSGRHRLVLMVSWLVEKENHFEIQKSAINSYQLPYFSQLILMESVTIQEYGGKRI